MKSITTLFLVLLSFVSFGKLKPGFEVKEVKNAIALCNSFQFNKQFGTDKGILPKGFELVYESDVQSMDNKFQIFKKGKTGVINYRGSTEKVISWVENCYSAMIPARDSIIIREETKHYAFAKDKDAAVHAGYALTIVILSKSLIEQIKSLNKDGIYDFIITGHSQGGALATMTRAYLENLPENIFTSKSTYKTYAFAQPMCGNKEFAAEYNLNFSDQNTSFFITNPRDPIPNLPFNYEEDKLVSKQKVGEWMSGKSRFSFKKLGQDAFIRTFEKYITGYIKNSNALLNKLLSIKMGKIIMPVFVGDINYYPTGQIKMLDPFEYPKIELDTTGMDAKVLATMTPDEDGNYYKEESSFYQHKPYNYYVGVLKKWDTKSYAKLEEMYQVADL